MWEKSFFCLSYKSKIPTGVEKFDSPPYLCFRNKEYIIKHIHNTADCTKRQLVQRYSKLLFSLFMEPEKKCKIFFFFWPSIQI